MRTIDADELKKALNYVYSCEYIESKSKEGIVSDIIEEIDNAPTVKFSLMPADESKEEAYMRGYKKGKIAGILKGKERPQGEWIKLRDYDFKCSLCGLSMMDKYNFCPECGADMRGEEE